MFCFRLNYEGAIIAKRAANDVTEATGLQKFVAGAIGKKHVLGKYDQFAVNTSCFWELLDQILLLLCNFAKYLLQK